MKNVFYCLLTLLFISSWKGQLFSQPENRSKLTIDQIMQKPSWIGTSPDDVWWADDCKVVYFQWKQGNETETSLYSYSLTDKKIEKVILEKI